jgi:pyruvate dehydrogenase E2 component (dihydrolipoamide acetyltransferase)
MNQPITMPALSDTMNNGRLVRWVKKIGDPIKKGDAVAEIETDKAVMEVEAFHDGYLAGPLALEDSQMPVGATIAYISDNPDAVAPISKQAQGSLPTKPVPAAPTALTSIRSEAAPVPPSPITPPAARPSAEKPRVRASPYARRLAQELGVDVKQLISAHGDVHADAVLASAERPVMPELAAGPPYHLQRASSVREALAHNMISSLATPVFHVTARLALAGLHAVAKDTGISFTLLLARACAMTVKAHELFSAMYTPDGLAMRERVDVGIAVDTPEGLVAPVLRDVAARPLSELATDWNALHEKTLKHRLSLHDYQGATFYLSNLGVFSVVHSFDAVLPQGAAAILCVASADGDRTSCTLECDHRILAGADAARFLQTLAEWIANPRRLIEPGQPAP